MPDIRIEPSWKEALAQEFGSEWFAVLAETIRKAYLTEQVFPQPKEIFHAFDACPFDQVRVVILGQDPYHDDGQAHGLSFSVPAGQRLPPSLLNIFKEMRVDVGDPASPLPKHGDLTYLTKQGVLLLNAMLTVLAHKPASHRGVGWERFTDAVIRTLSERREGIVFVLWGAYAKSKAPLIDAKTHYIITSVHPSPLSAHAGFFGSKPFSKANAYLVSRGESPVEWLPPSAS